jgi:hypothetical protein
MSENQAPEHSDQNTESQEDNIFNQPKDIDWLVA